MVDLATQREIAKKAQDLPSPQLKAQFLRDNGIELPSVVETQFPPLTPLPEGPFDQFESQGIFDRPVEDIAGPFLGTAEGLNTRNRNVSEAAAIKADVRGTDAASEALQLDETGSDFSGEALLNEAVSEQHIAEQELISDIVGEQVIAPGQDPECVVQGGKQLLRKLSEEKISPFAP